MTLARKISRMCARKSQFVMCTICTFLEWTNEKTGVFIFWNVYKNSSKNFQNFETNIFKCFWTKTINYFYFCSNKISNFILEHGILDAWLHIFHLHIFTRIVQLEIHVIFNIWWFATVKNSIASWSHFFVLCFRGTGQASCSLNKVSILDGWKSKEFMPVSLSR